MSVFELVSELCEKVFDSEFTNKKWYPDLPKIRRKALKKLRSKSFEILLHKSSTPDSNYEEWNPAAQVVGHILVLQQQGLYQDANKMKKCAKKLLDSKLYQDPLVLGVLELLLRLQDSVPRREDYEPILFRYEKPTPYDPAQGPMPYEILHPSTFEPQPWMLHLLRPGYESSSFFPASGVFPFTSEPGQGLPVLGRFLNLARLDGSGSKVPLYNIPQFPALTEPRGLQIPQLVKEKPVADEGYATPSNEDLCNISSCERSPEELMLAADAIWEAALTYNPPALRTWESLGQRIVTKERPFLSEAGQEAAKHVFEVTKKWPSIHPGHKRTTAPHFISMEKLLQDVGYLLLGVESQTFIFSEEEFAFHLAPGVCIEELSPLGIINYCQELLELGTCARRLQLLCERGVPGHPRTQLMEALREHVDTYLQFHWGAALMPRHASLLALWHWAHGLHRKTVAMARLCGVAPASDSWDGPKRLPAGMALVSYVYDTLSQETRPDVRCILYSTLQAVLRVYFRFLQQWIFKGSLFDAWEEFFIQAVGSAHTLSSRDRNYWAHVFKVVHGAVPGFLRGLEDDILLCGKTVHLLKLCCPKASLCVALESGHPLVPWCQGGRELHRLSAQCRQFERRVQDLELSQSDSGVDSSSSAWRRRGQSEAEMQERLETIRQAREHRELRIKLQQEASRQAVVQKQMQWRAELQQQVQAVQEHRQEELRKERQEEIKMLEADRQAQLEENRRKEEERQQVIDYYEELSEIVMKRKQLAEWRIERMNLRDRRKDFILNEWKSASAELNKRNLEISHTGIPLSIIEEDGDSAAKPNNPVENHALTLNLSLATRIEDNNTISTDIDNATTDQTSPNNNNINNSMDRGDINKNINEISSKNHELSRANEQHNLMNMNMEDNALNNVLIPVGNQDTDFVPDNCTGEFDNSAFSTAASIKAKIHYEEYGIISHGQNDDEQGTEMNAKQPQTLSAAERNRLKVMEQEFGISQKQTYQRPKSVPLKSLTEENVHNQDRSNLNLGSINQNFQDTTAQRRANRWNMLYGGSNIITGEQNPQPLPTTAENVNVETIETPHSTLMKDTPSDEGVQIVLQPAANVDTPMSKSGSSGSVNHTFKSLSGQSSKTSSSYNIVSITSSTSFDMGSGKFSLNTPTFTDDGSVDTFKTCPGSGESYSSESVDRNQSEEFANTSIPYWKSHRLGTTNEKDHGINDDPLSDQLEDKLDRESGDTSDAVDYTDLTSINVALQKSIAIPLYMQLRLANEAVLKYFFQDLDLYGHFLSLRSFFFMMDGEYSRTMTNTLFQKISNVREPSHLLNHVVLNALLLKSLDASLSAGEDNSKRLSFKVSNTPEHFHLTSTNVLECLSLQYKTEWPLNIILTKESLVKYNVIFTFLIKVRMVSWRLEQCFNKLKCAGGKDFGRGSEQFHSVQMWRHEMTHFVRSFQNYIMSSALQRSWEVFEKDMNQVQTLDNLYMTHVAYVKKVLFRCLLYKQCKPLYDILMNVFNTILKFQGQLEASQWHQHGPDNPVIEHPDFHTLAKIHLSFQNYVNVFFKFVDKLIHAGFQTYLSELLEILNANEYYTTILSC